jgi:hypothetical protein
MDLPPNTQLLSIETSQGRVSILCDLEVDGDTLHLKDIMMYGEREQPLRGLLREMLRTRSLILEYAREAGFAKLRVTGHRTTQSSSANPGKVIDLTVKL